MENIEQRVLRVVREQMGGNPQDIEPKSNFEGDLGADSLDSIELVMALEDEFEIEIDDEKAERMATVQDVINFVTRITRSM